MIDSSLLKDVENLSLYIHVPFCPSRCDYCDFYSSTESITLLHSYFRVLMTEIRELIGIWEKPFYTIYLGGGNPAMLGRERLESLINLAETFGKSGELTIEMNPEDATRGKLDEIIDRADRISIGIESFDEEIRRLIGRRGRLEDAEGAVEKIEDLGMSEKTNYDLIVNVPIEGSLKRSEKDLRRLIESEAGHISLYSLMLSGEGRLSKRIKGLSSDEEADNLLKLWQMLESSGYSHYEVSNFAREGRESLHNQNYWNLGSFIGLGPSAESSLGYSHVVSMRNTEALSEYLENPSFSIERLNENETREEYIMLALRTASGIKREEYEKRFRSSFSRLTESARSLPRSLIKLTSDSLYLTDEGLLLQDYVTLRLVSSCQY